MHGGGEKMDFKAVSKGWKVKKKCSIEWNRIEYKDTWKCRHMLLWLYISCQVWSEETFGGVREGNSSTAGRPTHPLSLCLNARNRTKFVVRLHFSQSQSIWLLSWHDMLLSFTDLHVRKHNKYTVFDWPSSLRLVYITVNILLTLIPCCAHILQSELFLVDLCSLQCVIG